MALFVLRKSEQVYLGALGGILKAPVKVGKG
jgi:hypothetical protein